jgi:D-alanyl-D-alanine carboxypeptidase (penicillin-binding protein 5/6)
MLRRNLVQAVLAVVLGAFIGLPSPATIAFAQPQTTPARAAIVIDLTSGAVLLEKNANAPIPPASMSKLMTLEIVFDALDTGRLSLADTFRISERSAAMGGSKMFIRSGEVVSVENLLRGVIIQSGNDAALALAEAISGTEEAFATLMTQRAADIGLTSSHFANATGWPDPQHRMSPRDLATLAERIITRYPKHYAMFSETEFTWDGIIQRNRNPLLGAGIGADGLKTGHTEEAGYGLVASAKRGERRILLVVTGLESSRQRSQEAERLINWAFRAFETRRLFKAGEPVAEAEVWIGAAAQVALAPATDLIVTVPYGMLEQAKVSAHFSEPVEAPVKVGDEVGRLEVALPGVTPVSVPLVAVVAVERGGIAARFKAAARLFVDRLLAVGEG